MPKSLAWFLVPAIIFISCGWKAAAPAQSAEEAVFIWLLAISSVISAWAALFSLLSSNDAWFFFFITSWKARIFRQPAPVWDFLVRFECKGHPDEILSNIEQRLLSHSEYRERAKLIRPRNGQCLVTIQGYFNAEISIAVLTQEPMDGRMDYVSAVSVTVSNLRVSLAESQSVIKYELIPFVGTIAQAIRPSREGYTMHVSYDRTGNPLLTLYTRLLPPGTDVAQFQVNLIVNQYEERSVVKVTKESMHLTAHSATAFQSMAVDFLTLSPGLARVLERAAG